MLIASYSSVHNFTPQFLQLSYFHTHNPAKLRKMCHTLQRSFSGAGDCFPRNSNIFFNEKKNCGALTSLLPFIDFHPVIKSLLLCGSGVGDRGIQRAYRAI